MGGGQNLSGIAQYNIQLNNILIHTLYAGVFSSTKTEIMLLNTKPILKLYTDILNFDRKALYI